MGTKNVTVADTAAVSLLPASAVAVPFTDLHDSQRLSPYVTAECGLGMVLVHSVCTGQWYCGCVPGALCEKPGSEMRTCRKFYKFRGFRIQTQKVSPGVHIICYYQSLDLDLHGLRSWGESN